MTEQYGIAQIVYPISRNRTQKDIVIMSKVEQIHFEKFYRLFKDHNSCRCAEWLP